MPAYVPFMAIVTFAYLLVEVPFAAHLVDILGSSAGQEEIEAAEHVGRLLSGVAVTIALWGFVFKRNWPAHTKMCALVFSLLAVPAMYIGQKSFVDHLAETASPELRQNFARAALVRDRVAEGGVFADGRGIGPQAEDKAALGLFTFVAGADADVFLRSGESRLALVRWRLLQTNDVALARRSIVEPSIRMMRDVPQAVARGIEARDRLRRGFLDRFPKVWASHVAEMRNNGWRQFLERRYRIHRVPVPANWDWRSRAPFERTYYDHFVIGQVNGLLSGTGITYRDLDELARLRDVDEILATRWARAEIERRTGVGGLGRLSRNMSDEEVYRSVVVPMRPYNEATMRDAYLEEPAIFGWGGSLSGIGEDSVRAAIVPLLALSFSFLGAIVHVFKFVAYTTRGLGAAGSVLAVLRHRVTGSLVALGVVVGIGLSPALAALAIKPVSRDLLLRSAEPWREQTARFLVGAHGVVYPAGSLMAQWPPYLLLAAAFRLEAVAPRPTPESALVQEASSELDVEETPDPLFVLPPPRPAEL